MKSKANAAAPCAIQGVLPEGCRIAGDLEFTGGLWIDGCVEGRVAARGGESSFLLINGQAVIHGDVLADSVTIHGAVLGSVTASRNLILAATARVEGDLHYTCLEIQPGASIRGQLVYLPRAEGQPALRRSLASG